MVEAGVIQMVRDLIYFERKELKDTAIWILTIILQKTSSSEICSIYANQGIIEAMKYVCSKQKDIREAVWLLTTLSDRAEEEEMKSIFS